MVHIRNRDPLNGNCVNVTFALLDEKHVPLGTYGMPADQAWCVAPWGALRAGQRYDELYGKVPEDKACRYTGHQRKPLILGNKPLK